MISLKKIYLKNSLKKIALITGGNRGIGKKISITISKALYITIITTTQKYNVKKFNFYLKYKNINNVIILTLNLKYKKKIKKFIDYIKKKIGLFLIVINNAGLNIDKSILKITDNDWYNVININLNSIYHIIKLCLPKMILNRWGRIINISSVVAQIGNIGQTNYTAAKAGIIGLSKSLAKEIATKGITVNTIAPGFIQTNMTKKINNTFIKEIIPIKKIGKTKDIANVVNWLISNKTSYITGETINVNGGLYMK